MLSQGNHVVISSCYLGCLLGLELPHLFWLFGVFIASNSKLTLLSTSPGIHSSKRVNSCYKPPSKSDIYDFFEFDLFGRRKRFSETWIFSPEI